MARSPIALGYAQQRSKPVNAARLVNLFPEVAPEGSRAPWVLYGTPGLKAWANIGFGRIRAGIEGLSFAYILSGSTLYRVDSDGSATVCTGAPIPMTGAATLINNGTQIGLMVEPDMFYITGTSVTKVTDSDFPVVGIKGLAYIDGYGIYIKNDTTGLFGVTDLLDFSKFDSLDVANAESSPDGLVGILVDHREVWLFGAETIEVWANTGASPFPFERVQGALLERGCAAALSPAKMDNSVFWLGNDRIIYRAAGYQPERISTHAIEDVLKTGTVSDAEGMTYSQAGHHFYVLTFPTLDRTLVYDAATQRWHERQSGTSLTPAAWNVRSIFSAFGKTLVGLDAGVVAELDLDTYADLGETIRSAVVSLPIYPDGRRAIMHELELECELGVGITSGQGSDPKVMLRFSKDGGNTWSNERQGSLGPIGVRRKRAKWNRLGAFREFTAEFSVSDPVKRAIYMARYELEGLAS